MKLKIFYTVLKMLSRVHDDIILSAIKMTSSGALGLLPPGDLSGVKTLAKIAVL